MDDINSFRSETESEDKNIITVKTGNDQNYVFITNISSTFDQDFSAKANMEDTLLDNFLNFDNNG